MKNVKTLFDLTDRVAIITGGAGMLGQKHAEAIAEMAGRPVIADLNLEMAEKTADYIRRTFAVESLGVAVDITQKDAVERMVRHVRERWSRIDILINNAAMTVQVGSARRADYFSPFEDYPLDLWREALNVNLTGAFLCTQAVGKVMCEQRSGVILNIASDVGVISPDHRIYRPDSQGYPGVNFNTPIAYATTKAGLISFTRYLATYWADKNIRVNALSPAGVYNDHDPGFAKKLSQCIPLGRMAHKDEYKGAVIFLVSDASSFMTGANLIVDGGRTAW
jgi:NAD(P)-dependent dehydrogenase (short-subunit alcohol dehydrogenase family)